MKKNKSFCMIILSFFAFIIVVSCSRSLVDRNGLTDGSNALDGECTAGSVSGDCSDSLAVASGDAKVEGGHEDETEDDGNKDSGPPQKDPYENHDVELQDPGQGDVVLTEDPLLRDGDHEAATPLAPGQVVIAEANNGRLSNEVHVGMKTGVVEKLKKVFVEKGLDRSGYVHMTLHFIGSWEHKPGGYYIRTCTQKEGGVLAYKTGKYICPTADTGTEAVDVTLHVSNSKNLVLRFPGIDSLGVRTSTDPDPKVGTSQVLKTLRNELTEILDFDRQYGKDAFNDIACTVTERVKAGTGSNGQQLWSNRQISKDYCFWTLYTHSTTAALNKRTYPGYSPNYGQEVSKATIGPKTTGGVKPYLRVEVGERVDEEDEVVNPYNPKKSPFLTDIPQTRRYIAANFLGPSGGLKYFVGGFFSDELARVLLMNRSKDDFLKQMEQVVNVVIERVKADF